MISLIFITEEIPLFELNTEISEIHFIKDESRIFSIFENVLSSNEKIFLIGKLELLKKLISRLAKKPLTFYEEYNLLFPKESIILKDKDKIIGFALNINEKIVVSISEAKYLSKIENYLENLSQNIVKARTYGISENKIEEKIKKLKNYFQDYKILKTLEGIDISFKTENPENLKEKLAELFREDIYTFAEETMEEVVGNLLISKNLTVSVAESCTGGLLSNRLTNVPGSSSYFNRGIISYMEKAKVEELNIPFEIIKKYDAVSREVAILMAENIRKISKTHFSLSTTGIAGPTGGTKEKPIGLVYIGISSNKGTFAKKCLFFGTRKEIKFKATQTALDMLRRAILKNGEN